MYGYELESGERYRNTDFITVRTGRLVAIQVFVGPARVALTGQHEVIEAVPAWVIRQRKGSGLTGTTVLWHIPQQCRRRAEQMICICRTSTEALAHSGNNRRSEIVRANYNMAVITLRDREWR